MYATLYIEDGNLLTWHEKRSEAEADVLEVVQADPSLAGEFGYLCFDDDGNGGSSGEPRQRPAA